MSEELNKYEKMQNESWKQYYLALQGFFYFAQGAAMAVLSLLPLFFSDKFGIDYDEVFIFSAIISIPWFVKILWGILSDNVQFKKYGRRKPYILISGICAIVGFLWLPTFNEISPLFLISGLFISLSTAVSDAVIDSLSVDITPKEKRSLMQGVGWGMRGLGLAISATLGGFLAANYSWTVALYIPGIIFGISCFTALLFKEPNIKDSDKINTFNKQDYKKAFSLKNKPTWLISIFNLITGGGIAIVSVLSVFLDVEANMPLEGVGIGVTFFAGGMFAGAISAGFIGNKLSLLKMMVITTIAYVIMITSLLFVPLEAGNVITITTIVLIGIVNGAYESTQLRIAMDYSVGPIAGSMYNWYMSMSNIGQMAIGAITIGILAETLGLGFRVGVQITSVFLIIGLFVGYLAVKKLKIENK
ncbi:MAG: MFS transporter [archaeon]|nr:MFS transporter [archaeon]